MVEPWHYPSRRLFSINAFQDEACDVLEFIVSVTFALQKTSPSLTRLDSLAATRMCSEYGIIDYMLVRTNYTLHLF